MIIYNYNATTGEYISQSEADLSPLEQNVYLLPSNATEIAPPEVQSNQIACFLEGDWVIKSDFRGQTYYDSNNNYNPVIINFIGDVLANLVSAIPQNIIDQKTKDQNNAIIYSQLDENQIKYIRSLVFPGWKYSSNSTDESYNAQYPQGLSWTDWYKAQDGILRAQLIK